ncbi:AraC family transcriptional regulator [Paenibacillus hodogayensis]|uniref:AraC family transcriptional regulator n=1 Tax=Paenibacillus hodogayensis TaxID=279208 RepID=A0ABV5W7Z3_9BACL
MRKYPLQVEWDLAPESENIEVTPSLLAQSMFFYVQAVGRFKALEHYYTNREQYHSFLLLWTKRGQGRLKYGGKSYSLLPNDVFLIDCKEPHYYETASGVWDMDWLHFNGGSSQSYAELILRNAGPVHALAADTIIPSRLELLLQAQRTKPIHSDILSSKWIVEMLSELLIQSVYKEPDSKDMTCPPYILEIMNEMERNCSAKITLDDLAEQHSFSKYHLAREFKRYTGYSPTEYVTHVRLSLAKEMLKFSDLTIAQIAEQVGYQQASFFIKTFKQREGVTPLEFRKRWRA